MESLRLKHWYCQELEKFIKRYPKILQLKLNKTEIVDKPTRYHPNEQIDPILWIHNQLYAQNIK